MKAWRVYAVGDMRLDEVAEPRAEPGWVVVKVKVVQPSVTEVVRFHGHAARRVEKFKKLIEEKAPVQLFGHEYSGEVVEVGAGVTSLKKGDRVAAEKSAVPCGKCSFCLSGLRSECRNVLNVGQQIPGCFAEYAALPAEVLVKMPDTMSYHEGACFQSLVACVGATEVAQIQMGDTVVFLGQGAVGMGTMQIARVAGAGVIITTARRKRSLMLSKRLGADFTINAAETDPVEAIMELTGGLGADIVFETAGGSPSEGLSGFDTLRQAIKVVRRGGKIVQVANITEPLEFRPSDITDKKVRYLPPFMFFDDIAPKPRDYLVHLMATKRIQVEPTITHKLHGLDKTLEAFEITGNKAHYDAVNPAQVVVS
ncbi:MAG: zinc-binding dehydrogenase [Chloroflexota bacterium]